MNAQSASRILITGAAGEKGRVLRAGLYDDRCALRLLDKRPQAAARAGEECVTADLADMAALQDAMRDIDCIVHLAGVPREGSWDAILPNNGVNCHLLK